MKTLFSNLLRAVTVLGAIAFVVQLAYVLPSGGPLWGSDNPYILVFAAVTCLMPSALFYLLAEVRGWSAWYRIFAAYLPLVLVVPYLLYVMAYGELFAPAIAIFVLGVAVLFIPVLLLLLHWYPRTQTLRLILAACTGLWLLGYFATIIEMKG